MRSKRLVSSFIGLVALGALTTACLPPAAPPPSTVGFAISPTRHDFGTITPSSPVSARSKVFRITSVGDKPARVTYGQTGIATFDVTLDTCAGKVLSRGQSCLVRLTYVAGGFSGVNTTRFGVGVTTAVLIWRLP